MKKIKIIAILLIVFILVTGCSVTTLDNSDYSKNIDTILSSKNKSYNQYFEGYKYYVPYNLSFIDKEEYNAVLKDNYNNKYYLYVDAISYYYKEKHNYELNSNVYYSKVLKYDDKFGYVQINKIRGKYLIQYIYNYAKVECYVEKDDINDALINISYLLRSMKYNRSILNSLIGEGALSYKEVNYTLFDDSSEYEDFLDVVYNNEDDEYKKAVDEETIDIGSE